MADKQETIQVAVKPQYLADQSAPETGRYVFGYTVTIRNQGTAPAQLISRHWIVTDANNGVQEVQGEGVVGQQPMLQPGEEYLYRSGVVLATETGTMTGTYQMRTPDGQEFDAVIPEFALVPAHRLH